MEMEMENSFKEYIENNSFQDEEGIKLITVAKVIKAWEHFTGNINYNIDNIRECVTIITNNLYDLEDAFE